MLRLRQFVPVWCLCLWFAWGGAADLQALELTFVHTSDVHAHYESFDDTFAFTGFETGFGGSPRIAAFIEQIRGKYPNVVVADTGDQFNKSPYFGKFGPSLVQANIKALRYDMISLGNHEFVQGARGFRQLVKNLGIPILCANLDYKKHDWLAKHIKPWIIREIEGERVGFIGAVVGPKEDRRTEMEIDSFEPKDYIVQAVAELQAEGVNKIVLLSHCGFRADMELARDVEGLDVILGGHTHLLFSNTADEADVYEYPLVIDNGRQKVLLAHSGYFGKYVGLLHVTFDAAGEPIAWSGDSVLMDESVKPSVRVQALFQPYKELLDREEAEVVGYCNAFLDGRDEAVRFGESVLGNLVADVMLNYGKTYGAEIALLNGGSLTGNIPYGDVALKDVKRALQYDNRLVTISISGADLWDALEYGIAVADDPLAEKTGRFLQVAGLRFEADLKEPPGRRVKTVAVLGPEGFVPLEAGHIYKVITYGFVAKGGDGNEAFARGAQDMTLLNSRTLELLVAHFQQFSPVNARIDGRIKLQK